MELTLDKFGRVLIPKKVRAALGLRPGMSISAIVNEEDKQLTLLPAPNAEDQVTKYTDWGFPVLQSSQHGQQDYGDAVSFIRETYDEYFQRKLGF
ncbi:MAG: AbrB/MazE/SpoVT family DNA-binding domain-containing protein [Bacteroidota bacterium]